MPTAAKLVAAISLAILGYILSIMVMTVMPSSVDFGYFIPLNITLGLLVGWIIMGKRPGRGTAQAINNGVTGVLVLVIWGLAVQATNEMLRLAMNKRYQDVFEATAAIFQIGAKFGMTIATVEFVIVCLVGAVVSGLLTEFAAKRWR